jgi:hypothetical protein
METRRFRVAAALAGGALLVISACSGGTDLDVAPQTTQQAEASDQRGEFEAVILEGKVAYLLAAATPSAPAEEKLGLWFAGEEYTQSLQRLTVLVSTTRTARPGPTGTQTVAAERIEENGDGRMNVIYCMSSDSELVESDQQTVVSSGIRWSRRFALLDEIDGRW